MKKKNPIWRNWQPPPTRSIDSSITGYPFKLKAGPNHSNPFINFFSISKFWKKKKKTFSAKDQSNDDQWSPHRAAGRTHSPIAHALIPVLDSLRAKANAHMVWDLRFWYRFGFGPATDFKRVVSPTDSSVPNASTRTRIHSTFLIFPKHSIRIAMPATVNSIFELSKRRNIPKYAVLSRNPHFFAHN